MIKLKSTSLRLLQKEFQLGNKYVFVTRLKDSHHQRFTILDKIEKGGKITLKEYDTENNYKKIYEETTTFKRWCWKEAIFTLLNKEEASKHLKNVIANNLIQ